MKILLLDIETAPNAVFTWGLFKQNISLNQIVQSGYTLCVAAKWLGQKEIKFFSVKNMKPLRMLKEVHKLLAEADVVVHYNGKRFDMPTLNKEFISVGLNPPAPYRQIDLLQVVRKKFRFTSNKLDYVSQHLGLGAKTQHKGMDLWRGCMAGNPKDWAIMERYNRQDVLLLEKLYQRVLPWITNHPNLSIYSDKQDHECPNCASTDLQSRGFSVTNLGKYRRFQCKDCGTWSQTRTSVTEKDKLRTLLKQVSI